MTARAAMTSFGPPIAPCTGRSPRVRVTRLPRAQVRARHRALRPEPADLVCCNMEPRWLAWARQLAAIAQNGLEFSENEYDRLRYRQVREIALDMLTAGSGDA